MLLCIYLSSDMAFATFKSASVRYVKRMQLLALEICIFVVHIEAQWSMEWVQV